jgi:hypothetical protein
MLFFFVVYFHSLGMDQTRGAISNEMCHRCA